MTFKLPREHGAWAMLYVPFALGALVAGGWTWRTLLLWLAVTALFIGRDALVQWGRARRRGRPAPTEGRTALVCFAVTVLGGAPLFLVEGLVGLVPLGIAAAVLLGWHYAQAIRRQERTAISQFLGIAGLSLTAPTAYYVGAGQLDRLAAWTWVLCVLYFASSIFYVKLRVLSLQDRRDAERRSMQRYSLAYHAALMAVLMALVVAGRLHALVLAAYAPILARACWYIVRPVRDLNLKRVGVMEIVYSVTFLVLATWALRAGS